MGKTIRRKDVKGDGGWWTWKNEVRNDPKAAENYVHGDMPSRRGRWARTFAVKAESNPTRRAERRALSQKAVRAEDPELLDTTHKHQKHKYSDIWNWD